MPYDPNPTSQYPYQDALGRSLGLEHVTPEELEQRLRLLRENPVASPDGEDFIHTFAKILFPAIKPHVDIQGEKPIIVDQNGKIITEADRKRAPTIKVRHIKTR